MKLSLTSAADPSAVSLPRASRVAGLVCVAVAALGLAGWAFDLPVLTRYGAELHPIRPQVAAGFLLLGLSLVVRRRGPAVLLAAVPAAVGVCGTIEGLTGLDLGVERIFPNDALPMSPQAAFGLATLGAAEVCLRVGPPGAVAPLAIAAVVPAYLSLVGFLYRAEVPALPLASTLAVPAAIAMTALAVGLVVARPDRGLGRLLRSRGTGGATARALLPLALLLPPLVAPLRLHLEGLGWFDRGFSIALDMTATAVLLCAGIVLHAARIERSEAARRREEARFQSIVETTPEGIGLVDRTGELIFANERLLGMLGTRACGHVRLAESIAAPVRRFFEDFLARAAHHPGRATTVVVTPEQTLRFLRFSATPVPADAHGLEGILVVAVDDTSRRLAEERLRNRARELAQATRDLESFAILASHDLQEPLRKIQALADRAVTVEPHPGALVEDTLLRIRRSAAVLQDRVRSLLVWSRLAADVDVADHVDLGLVLGDVLRALEGGLREAGAHVEVGPLPVVDADPNQMVMLFHELLANALRFRRSDVPLRVRVRAADLGGDVAAITVEDNGIGFAERHRERIFEVFERLAPGPGSGVGLAICRRIVELHGGTIDATGEPGRGARFTVRLPTHGALREQAACVPADLE